MGRRRRADASSLTARRFRWRSSFEFVVPIAEALGAAHDHGIVHRDVKPANVLVSDDGRIKLADFGLAKFRDLNREVTRTAGVVGTVAYMSPEQAAGRRSGTAVRRLLASASSPTSC